MALIGPAPFFQAFAASVAVGLSALLGGCAPNYANKSAAEIEAAVKTKYGTDDAALWFVAPPIRTTPYNTVLSRYEYFTSHLRGRKDPVGTTPSHQLQVEARYADAYLRSYRSANIEGNGAACFAGISHRTLGCQRHPIIPILCRFEEVFEAELTGEDLERHSRTGLTLRVQARTGQQADIRLPGNYIRGYLDALAAAAGPTHWRRSQKRESANLKSENRGSGRGTRHRHDHLQNPRWHRP